MAAVTTDGLALMTHLDSLFEGLPARLDVDQVAELLGVSTKGVYAWLANGTIPGYQLGRTWFIVRDELKATLLARRNIPLDTDTPSEES